MAHIGLHIDVSSYAGKLIIRWKLASAPLAEVGRSAAFNFPYDAVYDIIDLFPAVYIVELWRSDDGVILDQLIRSWDIDASKSNAFKEITYEYVVDRGYDNTSPIATGSAVWADPVQDDKGIRDERLKDEQYWVGSRVTFRYRTDEIVDQSALGGGFDFTDPDFVMNHDDTYFVTVLNREDLPPGSGVTPDYADIKVVSATEDFDSTYYKKICVAGFAGTIGTTNFPDFDLIPDTKVKFRAFTGSQRYWKLQFSSGDTVRFRGADRNVIYLAKDEYIELQWKSNVCYVVDYEGWYDEVGEYILSTKQALINCHLADSAESDIADYIRLITELPAAMKVTYSDYDLFDVIVLGGTSKNYYKNRGKFAVDTLAGKFKWPDMREQSFRILKYYDATVDGKRLTQGAGGMQAQEYVTHGHGINSTNSSASSSLTTDVVRGSLTGTVGTRGGAAGSADDKTIKLSGGTEQRVDNTGVYCQIRY